MTQHLFDITFVSAAPFWALMIFAPRWHRTRAITASPLICLPPLLVYAVLVLPDFGGFFSTLANPELPALQQLLGGSAGAAVAWAHFIAFDLFLGRWIYFDSRERRIHPALISVLLAFTIVFAPLGMLAYLAIRFLREPRRSPRPALLTKA
ncbi:ABA4-like family protein [Nocardia sp. NBC_01329]|uniref:ABA4-like family protein n=1 Tax=Nocardia sp. NBC_01329 TaxID=2903594 RepID=UPI002E0DE1A6|nr:ABA4-like family protein [Nocardia sp. NBC_01329]